VTSLLSSWALNASSIDILKMRKNETHSKAECQRCKGEEASFIVFPEVQDIAHCLPRAVNGSDHLKREDGVSATRGHRPLDRPRLKTVGALSSPSFPSALRGASSAVRQGAYKTCSAPEALPKPAAAKGRGRPSASRIPPPGTSDGVHLALHFLVPGPPTSVRGRLCAFARRLPS
jgi:hypothetical protein